VADLQVCVNKLKDAEAVALKLQERLIAVQERADAAESQYTAVSMSLEKSKEEVGNLQTWSAELTHENQQLQSQVKQMATMLQENTGLKYQLANAQGQLQEILAKTETDANELKKSFHEATLDGEVQTASLSRELHRAAASQKEISSLKDQLANHASQGEEEPEAAILDVTVKTAESEAATSQQHASAFEAQVAGLQDAVAALENEVKAAEAEKSKLKKENKELCKADADKEKEITELVKDLPVPCAL
jgi:chromosome segregation ATPase